MKGEMIHRALVPVLILLLAAAILPAGPALAQTVCLQVNGEGLTDGTPIPGWDLVFGGPPAIATVTATANPAGVHSGSRGVRVNGDYMAGKEFDIVAKGVVTVDYWHYPRPGTSTNSMFALCGGNHPGTPDAYLHEGVDYWRYVTVWKNDQDLWWIQGEEVPAPSVASYSGSYTHIVVTIDTNSGLFDLNIGGNLVYQGTVDNADKIGAFGIRYVAVHSGRGGGGTDSYFDDILIKATPIECPPFPTAGFQDDFPWFDSCVWDKTDDEEPTPDLDTTFKSEHVSVSGGHLILEVPKGTREGGQILTSQMLGYGKYEARIQASNVNSTVQAFFVYRRPALSGGHGEIDIEFGSYENRNIISFVTWVHGNKYPQSCDLKFDPSDDFHKYSFYWYPCGVEFYVDDEYKWTSDNLIPEEPCFLMLNNWVEPNRPPPDQDSIMRVDWVSFEAFPETDMPCLVSSGGPIEDLEAVPAIPPGAPAGIVFPYGMFSFRVVGLELGQAVTLTVELPGPVPIGTKWWKYQDGSWYWLPIGDDDGDSIITVTLIDNSWGDGDSILGQITDPGGPGYSPPIGPTVYGLMISGTEGGSVTTPGEGEFPYLLGIVVDLVASPDAGYKFVSWSGHISTIADVYNASTAITMYGWYSITANFALIPTYRLTMVAYPELGGTVTDLTDESPYAECAEASIKAEAAEGYRFVNWTATAGEFDNANAVETTFTMPAQNVTVIANFQKMPAVTTQAATGIGTESATLNMNYTVGNFSSVEVRFACRRPTDPAYFYTTWVSRTADGTYTEVLTGLISQTEYEFKAQLKYDGSVIEGPTLQFTTAIQHGCFIATAAYGTPIAEEIQILRQFRDEYLLMNPVGKGLVDFYYRISPPMAEFITEHPSLKPIVRAGLLPAVAMSTVTVNTTPAEKATIASLLVLVSAALTVWAIRQRRRGPEYT